MISDWTISAIYIPEEGAICPSCFLKREPDANLQEIRGQWSHNGLTTAESEASEYEPWDCSYPVQPMISVEADWEEDCYTCNGTGREDADNYELSEDDPEPDDDGTVECLSCEGVGVTGPRCTDCGEVM